MAIFVKIAKQKCSCAKSMKIKSCLTLIWVWRHPVRSQWLFQRSEVNSGACVTFNYSLTANTKSRPLNSCIFILTSGDHTCPQIDLWPHAYSSWPYGMTSHPQNNFIAVLIYIDLAQLYFCLDHKNSHQVIIDCHTPVTLPLEDDKLMNYDIKKRMLTKTFILPKLEAFLKLFTSSWYTLYRQ